MDAQKEFSKFEEASTYAQELARQLYSSVSVRRIETGWVVTHQCAPDQSSDPPNTIRPEPVKLPEKTERSIEVYKRDKWWFVEGSAGRFSTEEQANKVADVIRRCQSGKTTGSPATVAGNTTKPSGQGTEKNLSRFEEVSAYSSTEVARKRRKPKKSPRQKATKVPDKIISSIPTQPHRTRPIQTKRSEDFLCIDCGGLIPPARVEAIPNVQRCTKCQSLFESRDPSIFKRRVDEGLAGSRDDNKKMRARQWGDMQRRRRE